MMWIAASIILLVLGYVAWTFFRKKKISVSDQRDLLSQWKRAVAHADAHRKILDADAVIYRVFDRLGYTGSMGDKLKKARSVIPSLNDVWAAHKLRNRIAHEPGVTLAPSEVDRAVAAFERVLRKFCKE